ncbi:sigma-E processing peptidase SpoIIGA [Fonticella tunisiensis]|uniref:Sporulation sigma-E factor-processing peptidase n=1 Tax=Fonticella tunisiensis TaxID=1096341 RepID=A0A4R7KR59_9CLOT|nr:sigma-E processing peptidase SpoIIGA [Fonticella tunisiensis]TDT61851.1 stage II sporulation protein GA (sporulation sigma-E factor processing peptidase) [Fonticella tunisiensis]
MRRVVYIDILIFENFFMNYLLLYVINRFCKCKAKWWRMAVAALTGALYVFVIFFPDLHIFYSLIMKLLISMIMNVIAFLPYRIKDFIKILIMFYIEAFIVGGTIFGFFYLGNQQLEVANGTFMIDIPANYIIGGSIAAIILVKIGFDYFENYYSREKNKVELQIILNDRCCNVTALIDTGNSLRDPLTNQPVIVVNMNSVYDIFSDDVKQALFKKQQSSSIYDAILSTTMKSRIRIIPYRALGVDNGMLTGVRVDTVIVRHKSRTRIIQGAIIALYNKPISNQGDYQALAYPEIVK